MSDPLDQLKQWRETTDAVGLTPGPWQWWGLATLRQVKETTLPYQHPRTVLKTQEDWAPSPEDAVFLMEARTSMPALLTAVENVLKLAERDGDNMRGVEAIDAIRDALGGTK